MKIDVNKKYTSLKQATIINAMQPILSDHQNDVSYIYEKYKTIVKFLGVIAVYISSICFFASKEIILIYFGNQWDGAVTSFHFLSISLFFQIVGGISGSIYQSVNKTKEMFISGIIGTVITVTGIIVGILLGDINGLALSYSIAFILNFVKSQWFLSRFCFEDTFWNLITLFKEEFYIFIGVFAVLIFVPTIENLLLSLTRKVIVSLIIYVLLLIITKEYKALAPIIPTRIRSKLEL